MKAEAMYDEFILAVNNVASHVLIVDKWTYSFFLSSRIFKMNESSQPYYFINRTLSTNYLVTFILKSVESYLFFNAFDFLPAANFYRHEFKTNPKIKNRQ